MKKRTIVYGFGRIGKGIVDFFLKNTNCRPDYIIDRNVNRINAYNGEYKGIKIIHSSRLNEFDFEEYDIFIGVYSDLECERIFEDFKEVKCKNIYKFSDGLQFLCQNDVIVSNCLECELNETCKKFRESYICNNKTKIQTLDNLSLCVTKKCTLKCRGCVGLINEIKKIKYTDLTLEKTQKYLDKIFENIGLIYQVTLAGGEALLNKQLSEIIVYLCENERIGYVKLLTNGTVRFSYELIEIINSYSNKIMICVDGYGSKLPNDLRENLNYNIEIIKKSEKIRSKIIENESGTWYDLGDFSCRTNEKFIFNNKNCFFRKNLFLSPSGILSFCDRNVTSMEYDFLPDIVDSDYCDLNTENDIKRIFDIENLNACKYCSGTSESNIIPTAVQW